MPTDLVTSELVMSLTEASCDLKTDVTNRANRVITVVSRETAPAAAAAPSQELRDSLVDMYSGKTPPDGATGSLAKQWQTILA